MTAPRLEVDLAKVSHNARTLTGRLALRGIRVTGVTKALLGAPPLAHALLEAGVAGLADARIENIEAMRRDGIRAPITLLRSPMPSQAGRVVTHATTSCNTEVEVVALLSAAAAKRGVTHEILLMVELGDLREGILPGDLPDAVAEVLRLPNVTLTGIGTNLACRSGVAPGVENMAELSTLATLVEDRFDIALARVSGGNSANLRWALGDQVVDAGPGRIDDLRLGEAILLGREVLRRDPIEGLHLDAVTLVAEVIESKVKPTLPWGELGLDAFGDQPEPVVDRGDIAQTLVALGRQDVDPAGLVPPDGMRVIGSSSDHLVLDAGRILAPGTEVAFGVDYSALVRAATSPFVTTTFPGAPARPRR